jgi:hypothetical protein
MERFHRIMRTKTKMFDVYLTPLVPAKELFKSDDHDNVELTETI